MSETCPSYGPLAILASAQIKPSSNPLTGELVMNQPLDFNMNSTYVSLNHLTSQLKQVGEALENAVQGDRSAHRLVVRQEDIGFLNVFMIRAQSKQRTIHEDDDNPETHAEPDRRETQAMFNRMAPVAKSLMANTANAEDILTAILSMPDRKHAAGLLHDMTTKESPIVLDGRELRVDGQRLDQVVVSSTAPYVVRLRIIEVEASKPHTPCIIQDIEVAPNQPLAGHLKGMKITLFTPNEWKTVAFACHREGVDLKVRAVLQVTLKGRELQVACSPMAVQDEGTLAQALEAMIASVKQKLLLKN
jgi:hypothetical protein|eukprot:GHVU01109458.1.p2 GENE.GHVU01109458.1~~GHVU01109458.1.p2  ORF type:complete len:304 (+),score=44.64 GHVU01109458.1:1506-2417(+)